MKKVTRKEIARMAGVSEATVSYVFTNHRYVSPELRERVLSVSKEHGYSPDMIARAMVMKTTRTIGVLTNDISSPLQMEVIKGIQKAAADQGFFVNVCGGAKQLDMYIDNFISRRMDGVFVSADSLVIGDNQLKRLINHGISVLVTSMRNMPDKRILGLKLNMYEGFKQIVSYLRDINHRNIAYISAFNATFMDDDRINAFKSAMKNILGNENPHIEEGVPPFYSDIDTGYKLTVNFLRKKTNSTAIITTNDMMALGAIKAVNDAGLKVPDNISVVGIDDISYAKVLTPALTTLSHRSIEYGERIFQILHDNINDKTKIVREDFMPELILRDTCKEHRP